MAGTYGDMQTRIADELARSDLTSQIRLAIKSAIAYYARRFFYFNELSSTFNTVIGQEYYNLTALTAIPGMNKIDTLRITVNGSSYVLEPVDNNYIENVSTSYILTGDPIMWAYYGQQIRLFPVPRAVQSIKANFSGALSTLSADADSNAWMIDGEALIRARAKADLLANVIRDIDEAAVQRSIEQDELSALVGDSESRMNHGGLSATRF